LNWTERIIRMRKEVPEIGWGDFTVLNVRDPAVLALRYDWRNNRCCSYTIFTNNRAKFFRIRESVASTANCSLIFLLKTTVGLTNPANTALCWKAMVTAGTGSADSTICCVGPTSTRAIPTRIEQAERQAANPAVLSARTAGTARGELFLTLRRPPLTLCRQQAQSTYFAVR